MSRIKQVTIVGTKKPDMSLLKVVNEAGFLDRLKSVVPGFKNNKKAEDKEATAKPEVKSEIEGRSISQLDSLIGKATESSGESTRVVAFVSTRQLESYLKPGGSGHGLLDSISDDVELQAMASNPSSKSNRIRFLPSNFTFADQINYTGDAQNVSSVILMDVPKAISAELASKDSADEIKEVLTKVLSHKNYVMTLNITVAKSIASDMDSSDEDKRREEFKEENYIIYEIKTQIETSY